VVASLIAVTMMVSGVLAGWSSITSVAQAAPSQVRLVQVLGKFDKFFASGGDSDSEFRLDFVMEVPSGTVKADGRGLSLKYDNDGTFKGTYGPGIEAQSQNQGGWWIDAGGLIPTANLRNQDIDQQYRIIRIDKFGPVDRVTISMQGDLSGRYDQTSPLTGSAPYSLPVTMQAGVKVGDSWQYFSYQYKVTVFDTSTLYAPDSQKKVSAIVGWDRQWGLPNAQTPWGYVINDADPVVPKGKMFVTFVSPWASNDAAKSAGACTSATSFYYQWLRNDGTPALLTPSPVKKTITPTSSAYTTPQPAFGTTLIDLSANGELDFAGDGPGYYRLVVWPIAVNPSLSDPTACTGHSYYADSVGDLSHRNAFTVGSVFYTGGSVAANVHKSFTPNPMPFEGTTEAVFTLETDKTHMSGVGFKDTLPSNLYFTGAIVEGPDAESNCGFADKQITAQDLAHVTDKEILAHVKPGPVLSLSASKPGERLDTITLQGGVSYNIQTGESQIVGASIDKRESCQIRAEVAHVDTVTGNSECSVPANARAQTNDATNVSYQSLSTVLGYEMDGAHSRFGECLGIAMFTDLHPTGVKRVVLAGSQAPFTTTVTSEGPSRIDQAAVVITPPPGTLITQADEACTVSKDQKVATCDTGAMAPGETRDIAFTVQVPPTTTPGAVLEGSIATQYSHDTSVGNDVQPITVTVVKVDPARSTFSVSPDPILADGKDVGVITARLRATDDSPIPQMPHLLEARSAVFYPETTLTGFTETDQPGTYTATIASTRAGGKKVVVLADGDPVSVRDNDIAHFVAGPPADITFEIDSADPVLADGVASHVITATVQDAQGNAIHDQASSLTTTAGDAVTVSPFTESATGVYTAAVASTQVGTHAVAGFFEKTPIGSVDAVFGVGPASLDRSTWVVTPDTPVLADGVSAFTGTVTVRDAVGHPIPGAGVTFTAPMGVTTSRVSATTDDTGQAVVTFASTMTGTFPVSASVDQVAGAIGFSDITFQPGPPDLKASSFAVSPVSLPASDFTTATAVVHDGFGHPLPGHTVTFGATGSAQFPQGNTCVTNDHGSCSLTATSDQAEVVHVTASIPAGGIHPAEGVAVSFFKDSIDIGSSYLSVSPTSQTVGEPVTVTVVAQDGSGRPMTALTAADVEVAGVSPGVPDLRVGGFQETAPGTYTFVATSSLVGVFTVSARVTGVDLIQKPEVEFRHGGVCVSDCSPVDATHQTRFEMRWNDQVADGVSRDTAVAYAYDVYGNPVAGAAVEVVDETVGAVASVLTPHTLSTTTGADGTAVLEWTSTRAGTFTAGGTIAGLRPPTWVLDQIRFTHGSADPARSGLSIAPASPIPVSQSYTATVVMRDTLGNPVPGETAWFRLDPSSPASLDAPSCVTGPDGSCSTSVTSTLVASVAVHAGVVRAGSLVEVAGDGDVSRGSPQSVEFVAGPVCVDGCSPVDPSHVTRVVVTKDGARADGRQANEATVHAFDAYGNPVAGLTPVVTPFSPALVAGPVEATGADGSSVIPFTSTSAGAHRAWVSVGSLVLPGSPVQMTFASGSADPGTSTLSIDPQHAQEVGSTFTVTAHLRDAHGNPVDGAVASFPEVDHLRFTSTTCTSGAQGDCQVSVSSTRAGDYIVHAQVADGPIPTTVQARFTPSRVCVSGCETTDPSRKTRVDVTVNDQDADGRATDQVTVWAFDTWGNPVEGAPVASTTRAQGLGIQPDIDPTGPDGSSSVWYASTTPGAHQADVTISSLAPPGSPVELRFRSGGVDAAASTLEVSPPTQTAGAPVRVTVSVRDTFGAVLTGLDPSVVRVVGQASGLPDLTVTDVQETAPGVYTLSATSYQAGVFTVSAEVLGVALQGRPEVAFLSGGVCVSDCTPVDSRDVTRVQVVVDGAQANKAAANLAQVFAFDRFGNPVTGATVASHVSHPGVEVVSPLPRTGPDGTAMIEYRSSKAGQVTAWVTVASMVPATATSMDGTTTADGSIQMTFGSGTADPSHSSLSIAPATSQEVGSPFTVTAHLRDAHDNPVAGAVAQFPPVAGVDFSHTACTSDEAGECSISIVSTVQGTHTISAALDHRPIANTVDAVYTAASVCVEGCEPAAPTIQSPHDSDVSNSRPLVVTGVGDSPGATVIVRDGDEQVCVATVAEDLTWSCSAVLDDGDHRLTAVERTPDGAVSQPSPGILVTVDTVPPEPPTITTANMTSIGGSAEPGATVTVTYPKEDGSCGTVTTSVNEDGSWVVPTPEDATDGGISAVVTDPAGNESQPGEAVLDVTPPHPPVMNPSNGSEITGTGEPGTSVTVTDENGTPVAGCETVEVDQDGQFACRPWTPLPPGTEIWVTATDEAGNHSTPVRAQILTPQMEVQVPTGGRVDSARIPGWVVVILGSLGVGAGVVSRHMATPE